MSEQNIRNLVSGISIHENLSNYLISFNGKQVVYDGGHYVAMNVNAEAGTVELYDTVNCDQAQFRVNIDEVKLV